MSSCYTYLSGLSPDNFYLFGGLGKDIFQPALNLQFVATYPWKTGVYIVIVVFLLSLLVLLFSILERVRNNRIMRQEERLLSDLFSKITHEIRTPLTIILGLSKQLRDEKNLSTGNLSTYLNSIERQGKGLSELFNQLLDLANLHASGRVLEWKTGNIVAYMEMVSETFRIYAKEKEIELSFFSNEVEIETNFVPDYLNKILSNLLSNAIKFSEEGSRIHLVVETNKKERKKVIIRVIDHGKGISAEILPRIFDLFYTGSRAEKGALASRGIGLTLVMQLTEALGGTVRVKSEVGKGSTFTVELPILKNEKQLYSHWKAPEHSPRLGDPGENSLETSGFFSIDPNRNDPRSTILVVEDNKDVALYIRSLFHADLYNIMYASNGEKAWDIANRHIPDIVISDVVMPKKNGIELCKEMKGSPLLNHIPVILVSAKNKESDLIEGISCGADSYVRKPFSPEELLARVENLLENRHVLKEKYGRSSLKKEKLESRDALGACADDDFLRHVTDIIYRKMKNPDFTPGQLAEELAISPSQLNKKLNVLTGYPSSGYILQVKLDHAKKLFNTRDMTIGEVAAECGIYDVNYFSRVFKKHTGATPTQFKRFPTKL